MEISVGFLDPDLPSKYEEIRKELTHEKSQTATLSASLNESELKREEQRCKIVEQAKLLRQFDSEQEALLFRNNQLSKRIEFLQEDLQSLIATKKSKRPRTPQSNPSSRSSSTTSLPNSVALEGTSLDAFAADLANKISENERLHNEIFDLTTKKRLQTIDCDEKISSLQSAFESARSEKEEQQKMFTQTMQELESKQIVLSSQIEQKTQENRILLQQITEMKEDLSRLDSTNKTNTEEYAQLIRERLPFIDNESAEFNSYNIPHFDHSLQNNFAQVFKQIANIFINFTTQTSLFHTYLESNLKNTQCDPESKLHLIQTRLKIKLHKTKFSTKPIENCLLLIIQTIEKSDSIINREIFSEVTGNFSQFVKYIRFIAKFHALYLEEQSKDVNLKLEIRQCNQKLRILIENYPIPLEKILNILSVLTQDISTTSDAYTRLIENIQVNLLQLAINTKDVALCYTNRIKLEENTINASVITDNQCLMSSFASLINTTEKLMHYFTESMSVLTCYGKLALKSQLSSGNAETEILRQRNREYMKMFDGTPSQSVLYPVSISLSNQVFSYLPDKNRESSTPQPRDYILTQLQSAQTNLSQVERENENLKIEIQLLKLPQRRKQKDTVSNELEHSTNSSSTDLINLNDSTSAIDNTETVYMDSTSNSSVEMTAHSLVTEDNGSKACCDVSSEREKLIREFYTQKLTDLNHEIQNCESKSSYFYNEIKSISKHLTHLQHLRKKDAKIMQESNLKTNELQCDLETTQKNYEHQLNVMSETMLSLNEQLSQRQDEVERLTNDMSLKKKGNKK